jgi:hypothetical protein
LDFGGDEVVFISEHADSRRRGDLEDPPTAVVEFKAVDRVEPTLIALLESLKRGVLSECERDNRFGLHLGNSSLRDAFDHAG